MEDYCTLFHIVPTVNGGYYYLCKNNNGSHYLRHKAERGTKEDLLFETTEAAQNYIDTYLTKENWRVEYVAYAKHYIPAEIIAN